MRRWNGEPSEGGLSFPGQPRSLRTGGQGLEDGHAFGRPDTFQDGDRAGQGGHPGQSATKQDGKAAKAYLVCLVVVLGVVLEDFRPLMIVEGAY